MQSTIHSSVAAYDSGVAAISMKNGTATSSRMTVTAFAGVARADGPNVEVGTAAAAVTGGVPLMPAPPRGRARRRR